MMRTAGNPVIRIVDAALHRPTMQHRSSDTEKAILNSLLQRSQSAVYARMQDFQFEMRMREQTLAAAHQLNASGAAFAVFEYSRCNPQYWHREPSGAFRLRRDRSPARALNDIFAQGSLYAFECATAIVIVFYKATLDTIGEEAYNRLFANTFLFHWNVDENLGLTTVRTRQFTPGDSLYFDNPEVNPLMPQWQGENVIFMGGNRYFGHGIGIRSAQEIIMALNAKRAPFAFRSAYLMDQATRPNYASLSQAAAPGGVAHANSASIPSGWPHRALVGNSLYLFA
jgi:protein-glutamine gamma-glutamyltransferase